MQHMSMQNMQSVAAAARGSGRQAAGQIQQSMQSVQSVAAAARSRVESRPSAEREPVGS
jgi:hypothetical protein